MTNNIKYIVLRHVHCNSNLQILELEFYVVIIIENMFVTLNYHDYRYIRGCFFIFDMYYDRSNKREKTKKRGETDIK